MAKRAEVYAEGYSQGFTEGLRTGLKLFLRSAFRCIPRWALEQIEGASEEALVR